MEKTLDRAALRTYFERPRLRKEWYKAPDCLS